MADPTPDDTGQAILNMLHGQRSEEALQILCDVIGTMIGGSCYLADLPLSEALRTVDLLAEDAKAHITSSWGQIEMAQ